MESVFRINASELDMAFINSLKALFKKKELGITVKPVQDETEFLLSDPVNRKSLLEAVENIKKNKNLISFTGEEFKNLTNKYFDE
ncbi:MAG: hypothetical protein KAT68_10410 [Bacteroidales bacterium]|nr:hypothetical protein [Bacteroidales bacterium]